MKKFKISTRRLAFTAVFAGLSATVAEFVPGIPVIGASGASIKFDAALAPIWGIVLGPGLGSLAALVGGLIAAGNNFLNLLTSFCTAISAFVSGALTQRELRLSWIRLKGWIVGSLVLAGLILGWYSTPVGREAVYYPILHVMGLLIPVVFRGWISRNFEKNGKKGLVSICLASYCGIVSDHMLGNLIFLSMYYIPPILFMSVLPISMVERTVLTLVATVIGSSLVFSLRSSRLLPREIETK
ncbi:MAG: hypothetical protein QXL67_02690 [Candidatus Bathyarchaeia archaeon]